MNLYVTDAVVEDESSGSMRVLSGPQLVLLGPYESVKGAGVCDKVVLGPNDAALVVTDRVSGESRLVKGPVTFVPGEGVEEGSAAPSASEIPCHRRCCRPHTSSQTHTACTPAAPACHRNST